MSSITADQYRLILQAGHPHVYSTIVGVAGLLGLGLIVWDSRNWELPAKYRWGLLVIVILSGLLGSGLPEWHAGGIIQQQMEQCNVTPKTILAGIFFGFVGAVLYKKTLRLKAETSDAFARGTCLMVAIGKLACYAQHCCFGIPVPRWMGQDFGDGIPRLPVQLLESAALFVTFAWLCHLQRQGRYRDRRLFIFFAIYGALRFAFEFLRQPIAGSLWGLGFYQWLSLGLMLTAGYQIWKRSQQQQALMPFAEEALYE